MKGVKGKCSFVRFYLLLCLTMCIYVSQCVSMCRQGLLSSENKGIRSPEAEVTNNCKSPHMGSRNQPLVV